MTPKSFSIEQRWLQEFAGPVTLSLASRGKDGADIKTEFDAEDSRRQRIFITYLSERRHLLKCVELLLFINRTNGIPGNGKGKGVGSAVTWSESNGRALATEIGDFDEFIVQCFGAIGTFIQNISSGSGWPALEIEWIRNQITEATHTMEIVFQIVSLNAQISSSEVVLGWLGLLRSYDFLDGFDPVCCNTSELTMTRLTRIDRFPST
jgi:nuclear pore complex protein Nup188